MDKEITTTIAARIPLSLLGEIHKDLKETGKSMSDFVEESVRERLYSNCNIELVNQEISHHKAIIDSLEKKKKDHSEKEKTLLKIPKNEVSFLIESKEVLEKNPTFCEGRINLYKNRFGKHYRISSEDFFALCYKAEDQANEKKTMEELAPKMEETS